MGPSIRHQFQEAVLVQIAGANHLPLSQDWREI